MNKKLSYILVVILTVAGLGCFAGVNSRISAVTSAPPAQTKPVTETPAQDKPAEKVAVQPQIRYTNTLNVVKNPNGYMNKRINCIARFDKFATLGLDYKPAFRSSETYISFLIYRPDTDKNIPLPEMKLFLKRSSAEKLIDLKEGDIVSFSGVVFSSALGDVWVDVDSLGKLKK
ncbi:MAG: hypothetical protein K6E29_00375 [Cyanobacteria bacterium RUI128]|nr:hypothetical protein [Cyanobacteria bacterium RUI128]